MFPYHDENETKRTPIITFGLIAANALVWLLEQGAGSDLQLAKSICELGLIPGELTQSVPPGTLFEMGDGLACATDPGPQYANVLTSMFLHGSWFHLLGNMWFLWLFGNNIEDSMTHIRFVIFYLLSGLGAALLQVFADPASPVPMVGASGAISGVMGAYLLLYPRVRVYVVIPLGFIPFRTSLPAWTMLLYWLGLQVLGGVVDGMGEAQGGVAFWAHIGGFVTGAVLVKFFARRENVEAHQRGEWHPKNMMPRRQ
jgi:membrane associated rhomboid family serine protease